MWDSSSTTNTSKMKLHVELFSQNIYRKLAEALRLAKGQETVHVTEYEKKRKKGIRMGLVTLGGSYETGKVPPLMAR